MARMPQLGASPWSRLLALPMVVACVLAYLAGTMHFALVQHRTCLEHGEVVHGEQELHPSEEAQAAVEVSFGDKRIAGTDALLSEDGSDAHCAHVFLRRVAPAPGLSRLGARAPCPSGLARVAPRAEAEPVERLLLAPKSSPPLA